MRTPIAAAFMLLSAAVLAPAAQAQETFADKVKACSAIKDDAARLKCFDTVMQILRVEPDAADTRMTTAKAPAAPSTASIAPKPATIIPAAKPETPDSITLDVTAITTGADGKLRFTLSNGETWRQTDSTSLKNLGKGPWKAEIKKAAMGSYMLKVNNKTPVRARPVE